MEAKKILLFVFLFLLLSRVNSQPKTNDTAPWALHGRLTVSKIDPHFLAFQDGTPFFWLGDTGWEMIHLLTREEIRYYYETRKQQGFNVIQTVILSEFNGLTTPNAYGALPLTDHDPAHLAITPGNSLKIPHAYDYWDHVDYAVDEAQRQGMFIALLPCWGEYVIPREGRVLFTDTMQAYNYGNFLGNRYRNNKNIIWILGGDRLPDEIKQGLALWRAMAKGIADGTNGINSISSKTDYTTTLMTHHCFESSSRWFQQDEWLDFNMWGSYHDNYANTKAYEQVYKDDALPTIKPTINGEPAYEEHPVNWLPNTGTFQSYDVRQIAYWSVLAGALGHTYGCNPIWQFYDVKRKGNYYAHTVWKKALFDEGAMQLIYLKNLIQSRPMLNRTPANNLILDGEGSGADHCVATKGKGYALFYLPTGHGLKINMKNVGSGKIKAWWFNPRDGSSQLIDEYDHNEAKAFSPPGISKELSWLKSGRGCDWVLVLDDANAGFPPPGSISK